MPAGGQLRGIVRSLAEVTVTADLSAPVTRAPFKKGEAFSKGDILLEFDCRRYREDLTGAEATPAPGWLPRSDRNGNRGAAGRCDVEVPRQKCDRLRRRAGAAIRMGSAPSARPSTALAKSQPRVRNAAARHAAH
jgi:hypothetical protein